MPAPKTKKDFLDLVAKVAAGKTARSENDLSSNLSTYLQSLGLRTVVDSSGGSGGKKRPDIRGYVSVLAADLVLPAELVIESKKPVELKSFANLTAALVSDEIWIDKVLPYCKQSIDKIRYFALTTFEKFVVFQISADLRKELAAADASGVGSAPLRKKVAASATEFSLLATGSMAGVANAAAWDAWCKSHLTPAAMRPLPLSEVFNLSTVTSPTDLEDFATRLADIVAGSSEANLFDAGLFFSVRNRLGDNYSSLPADVQRDLQIFLMSQHPGADAAAIARLAHEHISECLDEFVAASIHSLISRLFAYKSIEDAFCQGVIPPLVEEKYWVFSTPRYDELTGSAFVSEFNASMRRLKNTANKAVAHLATNGIFYDWAISRIDQQLFRDVVELFASNNFSKIEGDLLGRFFEIYAQKINRTKRKELGQYYTPKAIVSAIWALALPLVKKNGALKELQILDPSTGSGTFLVEGAKALHETKLKKFWEHVIGFDVSAQVIGVAYVNIYLAVLGLLSRKEADQVEDLALYATDTLDPKNGKYLKAILPIIIDEDYKKFIEQRVQLSEKIKRKGNFNLVIGNPPYKNNSSKTLAQMAEIFPRLLSTSRANARAQERNPRDDYAWFFAAADHYVGDRGVIGFVVSDSFCYLSSYRYFREDLLRNYRVELLVRLGSHIFQDVGPRLSFAIVVLEKRAELLASADLADSINYIDLRDKISGTPIDILGTPSDPRLMLLEKYSEGKSGLPKPESHQAEKNSSYSFYPPGEILNRVRVRGVPVFEKKKDRIFIEKWPGIITAFDDLLKDADAAVLGARLGSFFGLAQRKSIVGADLVEKLAQWSSKHGVKPAQLDRLLGLVMQIRGSSIKFDPANIKRAIDGSSPNSDRWYPKPKNTVHIYFEPRFRFSRNENEGKATGWGDMQQWRDSGSHTIQPKLIFTTGTKPQYGLKAFVVHDEWYVKLHGGTSQQYHYTGMMNPSEGPRTDGLENNLTDHGLAVVKILEDEGLPREALLFYIAGIYNSELAAEFIESGGSSTDFRIRIPKYKAEVETAVRIAKASHFLRELYWFVEEIRDQSSVSAAVVEKTFSEKMIKKLGLVKKSEGGGRFKTSTVYDISASFPAKAEAEALRVHTVLDAAVSALYS